MIIILKLGEPFIFIEKYSEYQSSQEISLCAKDHLSG